MTLSDLELIFFKAFWNFRISMTLIDLKLMSPYDQSKIKKNDKRLSKVS